MNTALDTVIAAEEAAAKKIADAKDAAAAKVAEAKAAADAAYANAEDTLAEKRTAALEEAARTTEKTTASIVAAADAEVDKVNQAFTNKKAALTDTVRAAL